MADKPVAKLSSGVGIYEIATGLYQSAEPMTDFDWGQLWDLADVVVGLHMQVAQAVVPTGKMLVKWHIEDGPLPNLEVLRLLVELLAGLVEEDKSIVVFCGAGANRSGLVTALVVRLLTGETGRRVADHVRSRRPGALINGTFNSYLHALPDVETELVGNTVESPVAGEIEGI